MMILALCTIVLFVIVASLIEAWLAKARKAKSEADTLSSGPEASQRSVEKSEAVEQAVDNAGGFDLDEWRKARAPESVPDRRPWFFKTVMGRGLVCLLTKVIPILLPVVWFSLVVMGMLPNPLALFFFSPDPQPSLLNPANGWFWLLLTMFIVAVLHRSFPLSPFHPAGMSARCSMWNTSMSRPCGRASTSISLSFHAPAWH